jgi:acyl dehydratase
MPFDASLVGTAVGPFEEEVDPGWTMAYAAGIGDLSPVYVDSLRSSVLVAHPVFPVCLVHKPMEELERRLLSSGLQPDEALRRVRATHDMMLFSLPRPPLRVGTRATLIAAEQKAPGAYAVTRYEITDAKGKPLATIDWGQIYRRVELTGEARRIADSNALPRPARWDGHFRGEFVLPIAAGLAQVYAACSRQPNLVNIHTDTSVAKQAELPAPILMGSATVALSISKIITAEVGGDPERISRIYARFGAMVLMPSEITVRMMSREQRDRGSVLFFETLNADGGQAIREGIVWLRN